MFLHFSENLGSRFSWGKLEGTREKWCLRISRDSFLGNKTGLEANIVIVFRFIPLSALALPLILPPSGPPGWSQAVAGLHSAVSVGDTGGRRDQEGQCGCGCAGLLL